MRQCFGVWGGHFCLDQFAFSSYRQRHPLGLRSVAPQGDQIEPPRLQALYNEAFHHIAYRYNPASPHNPALNLRGAMWKPKNAARGHQFGDLVRRERKSPLAEPEQDERLHFGFGRLAHCVRSASSSALASGVSSDCNAASSKATSSGVRNPSGARTGTTL